MIYFLILFNITLAQAFPELHDFAKYEAFYKDTRLVLSKKIIEYFPADDTFKIHTQLQNNNEMVFERVVTVARSFLYSEGDLDNVLRTCVSREGAISSVMIRNHLIRACEFYHEDSGLTYMIGKVPFGQVRFLEYLGDGEFLDFNLFDFSVQSPISSRIIFK